MQTISPCLWFDNQAEEAAKFYVSIFRNSKLGTKALYPEGSPGEAGSVMTVAFSIEGYEMLALNGGPLFKITPALSFIINRETPEEVDALWGKLLPGGEVMMALDKYPFNERYGWLKDKFGVTWQIMCRNDREPIQPSFLFTDERYGQAKKAIDFYLSVFPDSAVTFEAKGDDGALQYSSFTLRGQTFAAMDGPGKHGFTFNEGISLMVLCDTQEEMDHYSNALSAHPESEQCGWLKDKFGVSWQITPKDFDKMYNTEADPVKAQRAMQAMMQMKRLDIAVLQKAYDGE